MAGFGQEAMIIVTLDQARFRAWGETAIRKRLRDAKEVEGAADIAFTQK